MSDSNRDNMNTHEAMTCDAFELLVEDFNRGDLSEEASAHCDLHLEGCARCRSTLSLWKSFSSSVEEYLPPPLPPLVERRMIVDAINAASAAPPPPARRWAMAASVAGIGLAAAATLLFVITNGSGFRDLTATPAPELAMEPSPALPLRTETLEGGRTLMRIDSVTELWVDGESSVDLTANTAREARVKLTRGRLIADIGPHAPGYRFIVSTPQGEVEAKGTVFSVEVADGVETARVIEGAVEVRIGAGERAEGAFMVMANQEGKIGDSSASWSNDDAILRDLCLIRGCRAEANVEVAAAQELQEVKELHENKYEEAVASKAPKGKRAKDHAAAASKRTARPQREVSPVEQKGTAKEDDSRPDPAASESSTDAVDLVRTALSQRREGKFQAAASTYDKLIKTYPGTQESLNALVSLGQLELASLSAPARALSRFDEYLRRAPNGVLAQEARLGKVRASWRAGRFAQAEAASTDYLEKHPGGYAGSEVMKTRGDARRKLGNCEGAIKDYTQIRFWWPTSNEAARVESGIAACSGE